MLDNLIGRLSNRRDDQHQHDAEHADKDVEKQTSILTAMVTRLSDDHLCQTRVPRSVIGAEHNQMLTRLQVVEP